MKLRQAVLMLLALSPLSVSAWWSADWTTRKEIILNTSPTGANLGSALQEPTVLLRLHQGNFPQFLSVRDGGADFRVVLGDDLTPLKYHVEMFDPISKIALLWVKLPVLNPQSTADKLYLYFGNGAAVKGDEAAATYDTATVAAFHFNEAEGAPIDSTAYATTVTGGDLAVNRASIIGNGATLAGTQALTINDTGALSMVAAQGWTFSSWVRIGEAPSSPVYVLDRATADSRLSIAIEGTQLIARFDGAEIRATTPFGVGQWAHLAVVVEPAALTLYMNGVAVGTTPITARDMTGSMSVGGASDGTGLMSGDLDELKFSNVARSADWVTYDAAIQGERNDALVQYGIDQTNDAEVAPEETGGYFGIIFQQVFGNKDAIVEQVGIGVCALMALIAALVMFFKALYLVRARSESRRFLGAYQTLEIGATGAHGLAALVDKERRYGTSPLFHVYRQALAEVQKRASPAVGANHTGLDEKAMGSIRAGMDAVMVRQSQKMNALMVLLTIAISGGPFIGLLGTVVGVMVTFAAIAATGDVNINAIAPGMAAALLATVAGLGVAIPSLFGYNYLGSRVKELAADMHVFADELTARIVEEFGH